MTVQLVAKVVAELGEETRLDEGFGGRIYAWFALWEYVS